MDTITLDFEQAKAKHLLFKSKLRSILYGAPVDEASVLSDKVCSLGKWIADHALQAYGHVPEMIQLEKVHADIHVKARELVDLYKQGKVEAARGGLIGMEKIADDLLRLLSTVEEKLHTASPDLPADPQLVEASLKDLVDLTKAHEELDRVIRNQSGKLVQDRQPL